MAWLLHCKVGSCHQSLADMRKIPKVAASITGLAMCWGASQQHATQPFISNSGLHVLLGTQLTIEADTWHAL